MLRPKIKQQNGNAITFKILSEYSKRLP